MPRKLDVKILCLIDSGLVLFFPRFMMAQEWPHFYSCFTQDEHSTIAIMIRNNTNSSISIQNVFSNNPVELEMLRKYGVVPPGSIGSVVHVSSNMVLLGASNKLIPSQKTGVIVFCGAGGGMMGNYIGERISVVVQMEEVFLVADTGNEEDGGDHSSSDLDPWVPSGQVLNPFIIAQPSRESPRYKCTNALGDGSYFTTTYKFYAFGSSSRAGAVQINSTVIDGCGCHRNMPGSGLSNEYHGCNVQVIFNVNQAMGDYPQHGI